VGLSLAFTSADAIGDEERELMLERLTLRFQAAGSTEERKELWNQISLLIRGRSKAQVERMERAKGLRA